MTKRVPALSKTCIGSGRPDCFEPRNALASSRALGTQSSQESDLCPMNEFCEGCLFIYSSIDLSMF